MSYAIHHFFHERGFYYLHTPIITAADAEGAGELFRVMSRDIEQLPKQVDGKIDFAVDFFKKSTYLTVSGQLAAEAAVMGLGAVYAFGPTFRAENSNTTRHLAEFWMVEPEVAFSDLNDNIVLAETLLKFILDYVLKHCDEDLNWLHQRSLKNLHQKVDALSMPLLERLHFVLDHPFARITYTEAIEILMHSTPNQAR